MHWCVIFCFHFVKKPTRKSLFCQEQASGSEVKSELGSGACPRTPALGEALLWASVSCVESGDCHPLPYVCMGRTQVGKGPLSTSWHVHSSLGPHFVLLFFYLCF